MKSEVDKKTRWQSCSRRQFIKNSILAAGAASALATANAVPVKAATTPSKLSLIVSGYKLDRTEALIDGRVQVDRKSVV